MQFERLTSLERILENGNLEGKNTKKKKIYQDGKRVFKDGRDFNGSREYKL